LAKRLILLPIAGTFVNWNTNDSCQRSVPDAVELRREVADDERGLRSFFCS